MTRDFPFYATLVLCLAAAVANGQASDKKYLKAEGVPTCSRNAKDLGACLKEVVNIMVPRFKGGNADLKIPPYDPFVLDKAAFQYDNGPVSGRIAIRNAKVYGFAQAKHDSVDVKINGEKVKIKATVLLPQMLISSEYKADMQFNNARLKPKGRFNVTMSDVVIDELFEGVLYNKDDHQFVRLEKSHVEPKVAGLKVTANGIFEDPALNELVVGVINQYWKQIYAVMLPETRQYWAPLFLNLANEALAHMPFDEFIKDN